MSVKKYLYLIIISVIALIIATGFAIKSAYDRNTPPDNVKVSVIVPVYNGEKYIRRASRCLINQTFKDYEVIFVDDGSTDKSAKMLAKLEKKHKNIRVITQKNQGPGTARNTGLENAKGDYVLFLDVDDTYSKDIVKELYKRAIETDSDIVVCDAKFNINGVVDKYITAINYNRLTEKEIFNYKDMPDNIFLFNVCCVWNKLYKKSFLLDNNLRFPKLRVGEDQYFVLASLALANKISIVDKPLLTYYVTNKGSQTNRVNKYYAGDNMDGLIMLKDYLVSKNLYNTVERSYINNFIFASVWTYNKLSAKEKKTFFIKYKKDIEEMHILDKDFRYYYNIYNFIKLKDIVSKNQRG